MDIEQQLAHTVWSKLDGPMSGATRIPELLKELLVEHDPVKHERKLESLHLLISDMGDVYETTLATVPILLSFMQNPAVKSKFWVLRLLNQVYVTSNNKPELAAEVYEAKFAGVPLFRAYLHHRYPKYRSIAAETLTTFVNHKADVLTWLFDRIRVENHQRTKTDILIHANRLLLKTQAIIVEANLFSNIIEDLGAIIAGEENTHLRCVAATAYFNLVGTHTPEYIVDLLMRCVSDFNVRSEQDYVVFHDVLWAISALPQPHQLQLALQALRASQSPSVAGRIVVHFRTNLFRYLMNQRDYLTQFTTLQKEFLAAVLDNDLFWRSGYNYDFESYGLKKDRANLRKQLTSA